jgi:putative ABC transport system ATP-binding protein
MNAVIQTEGLTKQYRFGRTTVSALKGIDVAFQAGTYYTIMGPSGSGKSSLLNILGLLDAPTAGQVVLDGEPVSRFTDRHLTALRQKHIGFIFQNFCLIPTLSATDNVAMPLRFLGERKSAANKKAEKMLCEVDLADRMSHLPSELSGGERQRVAIARAIVKKPRLILADEPTGNLDSKTSREIVSISRSIVETQGTTVIQVTHDRDVAEQSDQIFTLKDGQIIQ